MKTLQVILLLMLTGSSLQLVSQVNPVSIDLRNNGVKLDAKFYAADKGFSAPTVILLHGFPGNANSPFGLAERLNKNGMNILVFNYEGSFNSEGIFSWENCMSDAGVALSFLKQKSNIQQFAIDTSKIIVCGCSLGAALALSAAIHNPEIKKIIAVAGGNDLSIYLQKMERDPAFRVALEKRIAGAAIANVPIRSDSGYIHNYFGRIMSDYEYFDLIKNVEKLKNKEIFFITGWLDTTVPMEEFIIPTYRHLKNMNPEFVSIKAFETDHNFTNKRDELANSITEWIKSK
ncbi:MAG: alpha/beta hydrolase [Flavobacteriaceae bacterium]|nr:alpha/beta hydrolase [Flavobacteriaceae bacterium]